MKYAIGIAALLYAVGFFGVLALHTQMPATLGLALTRSSLWPLAAVTGRWWPPGSPLPMD